MQEEKKLENTCEADWESIVGRLGLYIKTEQYHQILETIIFCIKMLKEGRVNVDDCRFSQQLMLLYESCKRLDEIADEFLYRKNVGEILLGPLCQALKIQKAFQALKIIEDDIALHLNFKSSVRNTRKKLCNHDFRYHEDFINYNEKNPHRKLLEIHAECVEDAQLDLENYGESAIVMRVLDFWRTLSYNDYRSRDIQPLLGLGEDLLGRIRENTSPLRKNALWRMVLLLQMLLKDHPAIKVLKSQTWPSESFVESLIPVEAQYLSQSQFSSILPGGVLKDYQSQLQKSRGVFVLTHQDTSAVFKVQLDHDLSVIKIVEDMVLVAISLLGEPPCQIAFCLLGSTARKDRRPYSDLEYMILHSDVPAEKKKEVDVYLCHLISIFELMVIGLGETPGKDSESVGGFRIDTSVLESKSWGTPEEMAERFVTEFFPVEIYEHLYQRLHFLRLNELPAEDERDKGTVYLVDERDNIIAYYYDNEGWISSSKKISSFGKTISINKKESTDRAEINKVMSFFHCRPSERWTAPQLYEYLYAALINKTDYGGDKLLKDYHDRVRLYLQKKITVEDHPDRVAQRLNFPNAQWWNGLNQGQAIALICLHDIVGTSAQVINGGFQDSQEVNIKRVYYKPLIYFAMNLKLYFGWNEPVSPVEILQKYCGELKWGGEALFAWLKAALTFVANVQVKMHLDARYQKDVLNYSVDTAEERMLWAGLDLIGAGFIQLLEQLMKDFFEKSLSMEIAPYNLMKEYLNVRRVWLEKWVAKGLERNQLLNHPLMQILASYPDESGWSPQMELILKHHHEGLLKLSSKKITSCEFAGWDVEGKQPPRYLTEEIIQECFKEGNFVGDPELAGKRSQVKKIIVGDKRWYIKVKEGNLEGLMAREYLAMMVHLLLGGKPQVALGWPVQLRSEYQGKIKFHYAWISEGIRGDSLGKVMLESPEFLKANNINLESFTQLFLLSYLICPEDGQPENFKIIHKAGEIQLVAIDYGQSFVQVHRKTGIFNNKDALAIKTMIYLLENMGEGLSSDIITRIRLLDINQWFETWQGAAQGINVIFQPLLAKDPAVPSRFKESAKPFCLVEVGDGLMLCVKKRLDLLQNWLRTTKEKITGSTLLKACDPLVYLQYESLRGMIKIPKDFYDKLDKDAYEENAQGKMISSLSFVKIKAGTMTAGSLALSSDLEPRYFGRINFGKLKKEDQQFTWELLEAVAFRKGDRFIKLNLSGCEIGENRLIELLEKMTNLEVLDLTDCKGIHVITIAKLLAHRPQATIFTYNYNVLCPKLRIIHVAVEAEKCDLLITVSFEQRQLLTKKLRDFIELFERVVSGLLKVLSDSKGYKRASAAKALGRLGKADDRVVDALLKVLENPRENVKRSAAEVLGRLGIIDDLVSDRSLKVQREAHVSRSVAKALGLLGKADNRVIEGLLKALGNPEENVQRSAAKALGRLSPDDRVIEPLLKALGNPKEDVQRSAANALGRLGKADARVVDALLKVLGNPKEDVQRSAANALGRLGKADARVVDALLKVLGNPKEDVQRSAAKALGRLGKADDRVIEGLLKALGNPEENVQKSAVKALGRLGKADDRVMPALLKLLESNLCRENVRRSVAVALGQLGKTEDRVVDALLKALEESNKGYVRVWVVNVLAQIGKADARVIEGLLKTLGNPDDDVVQRSAAKALGRLGKADDRVIPALLKLLESVLCRENVRRSVAVALGQLGKAEDRVVDALLKALGDSGRAAQRSLGEKALEWWGEETIIDVFQKEAARSKEKLQGSIAKALGLLGKADERVIAALLKVLGDSGRVAQRLAAKALGRLGKADNRVIEALLKEIVISVGGNAVKTVSKSSVKALSELLNLKNCWKRIQHEVERLPSEKPRLLDHTEYDALTKRIFFFADDQTRRALPQVCRKWRDLYAEFKEEQAMQRDRELRLPPAVRPQHNPFSVLFFGKALVQVPSSDVELVDDYNSNKAALASQRDIMVCELEGINTHCRVIPAEHDGDCGFTGTRRVLDLLGRAEIASQISRTQLIAFVREEFKNEHSLCKPIILEIFKTDGIGDEDEKRALEQWSDVFTQKGYWMQEAHFRFLSWIFNLEFCFYCVDNDKNVLISEPGYEALYEGRERDARIFVNLLHMTVTLRDENTQLNHFDGLVINPTLEQEQRINLMLEEVTNALHLKDSSNCLEDLHPIKSF